MAKNVTNKKESYISNEIVSGFLQAPFYPLSYVKVLIQIGHEPLPPFQSRDIFGRNKLYYPNTFSYLKYIYSVEGATGLYRGLGLKVVSQTIGNVVYDRVYKMLEENDETSKISEDDAITVFLKQTTKEVTARCWAVVFSQPFHVMALRCMAQFIGGETRYSSWNIFSNTIEIYKNEGITGFFCGLIPRLLFEASTIALTNGLAFLIKNYIFDDKDIDALIDLFVSLVAGSITYPLSVVSTVSSISGSVLVASRPPKMAIYSSWIDVFKHLYENNELKRGSQTFFRIYKSPLSIPAVNNGFVLNQPLPSSKNVIRKDL